MAKKRRRPDSNTQDTSKQSKELQWQSSILSESYHYTSSQELPWDLQDYWYQRYLIFSKYDDGIMMTADAWFGVTQESIATQIAADVAEAAGPNRSIIVDAFCGVGGNTIAFALSGKWKRVYAIEKDPATLECAKINAEIYGVSGKITWFLGDCFELLSPDSKSSVSALRQVIQEFGIIFASPPWGGPGYKSQNIIDLEAMEPYNLSHLYTKLSPICGHIALFLPRTSDIRQIAACNPDGPATQVVHYCTNGNSRALCTFFGDWQRISHTI